MAGAAIAAAADLLLILFIGWHDDKTTRKERGEVAYKEREEGEELWLLQVQLGWRPVAYAHVAQKAAALLMRSLAQC